VVNLLVDQIEFADVIVLSKVDLVTPQALAEVEAICRVLNPGARIVPSENGCVPLSEVLNTGRFNMLKAQSAAGWRQALEFGKTPETEEYGVTSFVYRARRPFHPGRLMTVFNRAWPGVWRSKGFFWLATRMDQVGTWSQAGAVVSHEWGGYWWATIPPERRPQDMESRAALDAVWRAPHGDRRQELVLIGKDMDQTDLTAMLDSALLTPGEVQRGVKAWARLPDPFPTWGREIEVA
jgi:G3E family GTPase